MEPKEKRRGLGRGLSALMADVDAVETGASSVRTSDKNIPIEKIHANPDQPRRDFSEASLQELADSINEHGVLQPLIVRPHPSKPNEYEIVAGERRWRAAQRAAVHELPVIFKDFSDDEVLEVAIVENVQRADLNVIEEAMAYHMLIERFGHTQDKVAKALGKSRSHIANLIRLLSLPQEVIAEVRQNTLSMGHARALLTANEPIALARKVIKGGLSVRETEKLAKSEKDNTEAPEKKVSVKTKDADTQALEAELGAHLGLPVLIQHKSGTEGGKLTLSYKDFEQLDSLCRLLSADA